MHKHRIINFLGLTVLYTAVIIGIFVLQFKTETIISRMIGGMEVSLSSTQDKDGNEVMKNQYRITYKGLTFVSNENNPVTASVSKENGTDQTLVLSSWEQDENDVLHLIFEDGTKLSFSTVKKDSSDKSGSQDSSLYITVDIPENYEVISIPYSISDIYSVGKGDECTLILKDEKDNTNFMFAGPQFEYGTSSEKKLASGVMSFSRDSKIASCRSFVPVTKFEFASVEGLPLTDAASYKQTKSAIKSNVRTLFNAAVAEDSNAKLSEKEIVAYVADMAEASKFNMSLNAVPASFKSGRAKSYLSIPYFADMVSLNESLRSRCDFFAASLKNAVANRDLNLFTLDGIADYLLLEKKTTIAVQAMSIPVLEPTFLQAVGVLDTYSKIDAVDPSFADYLGPSVAACLDVVSQYMSLENNRIIVGKKLGADSGDESQDINLTRVQKILIGQTLINYGDTVGDNAVMATGYMIVNQEADVKNMTLAEIGEIYHPVIKDNRFYPHIQILGYYGTRPVWAWTCAPKIDYKVSEDGITDMSIDFTNTYTHYVVVTGLPTFHMNIEIQQLKFRSDKNFEKWNSSGFVYDEDLNTLYLKSRHKSKVELIRLFCDPASNYVPEKLSTR